MTWWWAEHAWLKLVRSQKDGALGRLRLKEHYGIRIRVALALVLKAFFKTSLDYYPE